MSESEVEGQGALLPELVRKNIRKAPAAKPPAKTAEVDPVARVLVDVPLAHLDRPFDYAVPQTMAETAVPGARVKVRFAGQDVDGFVIERAATTEHAGRLQPLRRVVSAEPVLMPEIAELTGLIAARYAGTRSDVLRLAVPPRHATVEKAPSPAAPPITAVVDPTPWHPYAGGAGLLQQLAEGGSPRAVVSVLPGDDWATLIAEAVLATATAGRGALVCAPDLRDLARLDAALTRRLGEGRHVVLAADAGPAKRYAAFLAVARGSVRVVIGTRAAAFAPIRDLGLVAIWDDGDDLFAEPRSPYPHTREVLLQRAQTTGCAVLVAAHARSVEAEYLIRTGWATELAAPRATVRERIAVSATGDSDFAMERDAGARSARLPKEAFDVIRDALTRGPVLLQSPRSGYATRLACDRCRTPATCTACQGPLRVIARGRPPECAWCATQATAWECPTCAGRGLRAPVLGDQRTAEELGRAFPGAPVRTSSGDKILTDVPNVPSLVIATPGAEPMVAGGYAAVLLLDTWLLLARSDLRANEEALRRWMNAAAMVRSVADKGKVVVVGDHTAPSIQALVRWDPSGFARREMAERQSAHLPPASRVATLTGDTDDLDAAIEALEAPAGAEILGPVPGDDEHVRFVVRVPRAAGPALSEALTHLQAQRSARKLPYVRVEVDPQTLG